ncbi:MAG TPA: hypothetical protein VFS70_24895 [Actinomycetota bacterium]|nr:hypothetical protein [Actinomycetota bacterium]
MSDNVAVAWNKAALEAIRRTRMGPPMVARALHVLHAAMYDAWAAHDDLAFGSRLGDVLRRPPADRTQEAKREAASFAAHRALSDLFPTEATAFAKLMSDLGYDPDAVGPEGSPSAVGVRAARAVLAFRHGDGANQLGDMGPEPRGLAAAYADWTGYRPANPPGAADRPQPLAAAAHPRRHGAAVPCPPLGPGRPLRPPGRLGAAAADGAAAPPRAQLPVPGRAAPGRQRRARRRAQGDRRVLGRRPRLGDPPGHWCLHAQQSRPGTATALTRTSGSSSP